MTVPCELKKGTRPEMLVLPFSTIVCLVVRLDWHLFSPFAGVISLNETKADNYDVHGFMLKKRLRLKERIPVLRKKNLWTEENLGENRSCSSLFLREAILSGRDIYFLTLFIQYLLCRPRRRPTSRVPLKTGLERMSWRMTCPNHGVFRHLQWQWLSSTLSVNCEEKRTVSDDSFFFNRVLI